uniref:SSD domain-containing protein n=1 Tax=Ditylenchus dipsaci TaxID=166011 RepID=A0A915DJ77_9BILA
MRRNPAKEDCVAYRLSMVLIETGPAILISALTNITADAVGSFTGSPEITLLCIGNMASLAVDFFYQVTFYSSVMAIAGFYEMRAEASALATTIGKKKDLYKHSEKRSFHDTVQGSFKSFVTGYVNFITNTFVATAVFLFWIAFIAFSLGISKFEVNLTTKKIFAEDSPLLEIDHLKELQIVPFYTLATVFVNRPGDLADPARLNRLNSLLYQLEHMPELGDFLAQKEGREEMEQEESQPINANSTGLIDFKSNRDTVFDVNDLEHFLDWPEYGFWRGFLRLHTENKQTVLDSFFFTTAYHGLELRSWPRRSKLLQDWRKIIDTYPEFNASVYHEEGVFLDLIDNMPTDTWQSALATLVCMAAICFVFMYNTFTVLVASTIIASIITGMLGTLSWQGVSMDPIMMAATIISIGFSVDIPAHVSYHYHSASFEHPGLSVRDRLKVTLASVGFPPSKLV